jgi:hypothetical protein
MNGSRLGVLERFLDAEIVLELHAGSFIDHQIVCHHLCDIYIAHKYLKW